MSQEPSPNSQMQYRSALETFRTWQQGEPWHQVQRVLTAERHRYLSRLAAVSNTREDDMWIKGFLSALDFVSNGTFDQAACSQLGLQSEYGEPVRPAEDVMPRERTVDA